MYQPEIFTHADKQLQRGQAPKGTSSDAFVNVTLHIIYQPSDLTHADNSCWGVKSHYQISAKGVDTCGQQVQGVHEPKETSSREGDQYQATIPAQIGKRPAPGREEDDPHCGIPGPSTEQALALAKGPELVAARALPPDATSDILLGRSQSYQSCCMLAALVACSKACAPHAKPLQIKCN